MIKNNGTSIKIFDLNLFSRDKQDLLNEISEHLINLRKISYIFTPNPEQVIQSHQENAQGRQFLADLQSARWLIPDGIGIVWASRYLHKKGQLKAAIAERITGVDLVQDILSVVATQSINQKKIQTVLILGGVGYQQTDLRELEGRIQAQHPGSRIEIHWTLGYEDASRPTAQEEKAVLARITKLRPTVVFVALGAPKQERWLVSHASMLESAGVSLGMAVGGSFDYLLGKVSRAPLAMRKAGLEWLYRLVRQPWRLKRQLRLLQFIVAVKRGQLR